MFKPRFAFVLLPLLASLAACGGETTTGVQSAGTTPAERVSITASQALVLAELAYDGAVTVSTPLVQHGVIKPAGAAQLLALSQEANRWLDAAHQAKTTVDILAAVARANQAILGMRAIEK